MVSPPSHQIRSEWVLLTMGDRPDELAAAVASVVAADPAASVIIVDNGGEIDDTIPGITIEHLPENLGVPGGRDHAIRRSTADIVFFLDDDARIEGDWIDEVLTHFIDDPKLAAVSMRIVDERGSTARRHIPRPGSSRAAVGGPVVTFLGGACAIRREAYLVAGGYWNELWYSHEELDLTWRLHDAGFGVRYEPRAVVFHPRTPIGRHPRGWLLTGRNRVWVARRNLPWPLAVVHVVVWLMIGVVRARPAECRRAYFAGWRSGWSGAVERTPMSWGTVVRLCRLGRPPVI